MKELPLNRTTAPQVVRFFDVCFKQGVIDAYNYHDNYGAKDFLQRFKESWDFGVLGEPEDFDWEMWRFTLYRWARYNRFTRFAQEHIYSIVRKDYLWYMLPFCMRFYLMGIEEWLAYPAPTKLELFKKEFRVHWKPVLTQVRKMSVDDYISYMQEFTYEFRRSPYSQGENRKMSPRTMDAYCMAIHDLTRKYDTGRKLRVKDLEGEDV